MKAVILASGVSRPRKPEKSSMGFAEVLQIRQRLLAWNNPEHPYMHRFLANQALIEEALGSESTEEDLDETFRKGNFSLRAVVRKFQSIFVYIR